MNHRNCTQCGKPIILVPSAAERAKKYGGKPEDYLNLFTIHTECLLKMRGTTIKDKNEQQKGKA